MTTPVNNKGILHELDAIRYLTMIPALRGTNPPGPRKGIPPEEGAIQNQIMILVLRGMTPLAPKKGLLQKENVIQNLASKISGAREKKLLVFRKSFHPKEKANPDSRRNISAKRAAGRRNTLPKKQLLLERSD